MAEEILIQPVGNLFDLNLPEMWRYRELFYIFAWRDIKVRYKQTLLGLAWVVFQPLFTTIIFTVFFGNLAKIPSGHMPYALFVLCGLVFWNFFTGALTHASNSLIDNESILKKIYFPKIILPLSSIITTFVDFGVNFLMLIAAIFLFGFHPSWEFIPVVILGILTAAITASGLGLFLASVNVKYRDVRYVLPFFIQMLLFVSPVIYPSSIVRPTNQFILALNPMSAVIEAVRNTISPVGTFAWWQIGISLTSAVVIFFFGLIYFHLTEKYLADIL